MESQNTATDTRTKPMEETPSDEDVADILQRTQLATENYERGILKVTEEEEKEIDTAREEIRDQHNFIQQTNEMIDSGLAVKEMLSDKVEILNTTGRRFSREVISFYTLKAIDIFKKEKLKNFFGVSLQKIDDILEIGISSVKKGDKVWTCFDLLFFPTFGPYEKMKSKLLGIHIPDRAHRSFYVNNTGDVVLNDISNTQQ